MRFVKIILLSPLLFAMACGNTDTTTDMSKRDREREQNKAETLFSEYQSSEGIFRGSNSNSDYELQIKAGWTADAANGNISRPILIGAFVFFPNLKMIGSDPIQISYPINSGNYMSTTKNLTLNLGTNDSPTTMSCDVGDNKNLTCTWFTQRGKVNFSFQQLSSEHSLPLNRQNGLYSGENDDYLIDASFQSFSFNQGPSQIPQIKISASFSFTRKKNLSTIPPVFIIKSKDVTYDIISNTLTFNVDDNQALVNCKLMNNGALSCKLISNRTINFDLLKKND